MTTETAPQPFFNSATGGPVGLQRRIIWQDDNDVPPAPGASWWDFWSNGGPIAPAPADVLRQVITGNAMRQPPIPGKVDVADASLGLGDLDPGNKAHLIAWANMVQGFTTEDLGSGAYRHHLGQLEAVNGIAPQQFAILSDNNTGLINRWDSVMSKNLSIKAASKANYSFTAQTTPGKFSHAGDAVQTSGTGSTAPYVRHRWPGNYLPDATDDDIYVEITTIPSGGVGALKCKTTATATFAGSAIPFTLGQWCYLTDQANALLGMGHGEQVQVQFPVGATLVANDVFKIPKRRLRWSPSLPLQRPIGETSLRIYFNGYEINAEGGYTLTAQCAGVTARESTGGTQRLGTQRIGFQDIQLQLVRRLINLDLQNALLQSQFVSFVIEALTDIYIPGTTVYYGCRFVLPFSHATGTGYDTVDGGQTRDETLVFKPAEAPDDTFSYLGDSFQSDLTVLFDTDIETVT